MAAKCSRPDCKEDARARGLCSAHYQEDRRNQADPNRVIRQHSDGKLKRLVLYVDPDIAKSIEKAAKSEGITQSAAAVRALTKGLK